MLFVVSLIASMFLSVIPLYYLTSHASGAGEGILLVVFAIVFLVFFIVYRTLSKLFSMDIPGKAKGVKFINAIIIALAVFGVVFLVYGIIQQVNYKPPQYLQDLR